MKIKLETTHPINDESAEAATGRSMTEWFAYLEGNGLAEKGRKAMNDHLFGELKIDPWWCTTIVVGYEESKGKVEKDGLRKGYLICVSKTVNAPIDKAFGAWTSGAELSKWFGEGTKADVADGGAYSNADGNKGTFKRVRANKDLRFTVEDEALCPGGIVDVAFQDKGAKTAIMLQHDRIQTRAEADGLREAWGQAFDRLKAAVE